MPYDGPFEKPVHLTHFCCPATMHIKPFKALFPRIGLIGPAGPFCDDAKNSFKKYLESGIYDRCPAEGFYIYQIELHGQKHTGLIGLNRIQDFLDGHIKKHEDTLSERELQQKELFLRWKAILKPVLVTHEPVPELQTWLREHARTHTPLITVKFTKEDATHRFWTITRPDDIAY